MQLNIKKLNEKAIVPTYGSDYAAGADLTPALTNLLPSIPVKQVLLEQVLPWKYLKAMPVLFMQEAVFPAKWD